MREKIGTKVDLVAERLYDWEYAANHFGSWSMDAGLGYYNVVMPLKQIACRLRGGHRFEVEEGEARCESCCTGYDLRAVEEGRLRRTEVPRISVYAVRTLVVTAGVSVMHASAAKVAKRLSNAHP